MRIFSQNMINYGIPLPENSILWINLAWINSLDELTVILKKHHSSQIFLDLPIGRTKPPNNKYSFDNIISIIESNNNILFLLIYFIFIDKQFIHKPIILKISYNFVHTNNYPLNISKKICYISKIIRLIVFTKKYSIF